MFSEENKVLRTLFERWQGPPHINEVNQDEIGFVY